MMTTTCTCPRIDGFRIRRRACPTHNECLDSTGPIPKLGGVAYVCVKPAGHELPHEAPDGTWWEPPLDTPTNQPTAEVAPDQEDA